MSRSKSLTIRFNRLLYHPKRPKAKFHVTSDRTTHLRRGSTHLILDERGNPIDNIDEKLSYVPILAICGRTIVRFMEDPPLTRLLPLLYVAAPRPQRLRVRGPLRGRYGVMELSELAKGQPPS